MENLIDKYIQRIKVDYPEDDKLMIDLQDFVKEIEQQLRIADVSVSLLRKKAKEYAKFIYDEGYSDPMYHPEVMQTMSDFEAGFKAGMRFYNER